LKIQNIGGVGGNIHEMSKDNLAFQVRTRNHIVSKTSKVDQLGMGGLYTRKALKKIGYFSNPYFYAYEEYDLGSKMKKCGYSLLRVPYPMIKHYGDETTSMKTLIRRWKSKYVFGSGQYLMKSITGNHFYRTLYELKIYVFTLIWLILGIFSVLITIFNFKVFPIYLFISLIFILILYTIKKDIKRTFFSIFSWNFQAIGMAVGFFVRTPDPKDFKLKLTKIK